MADMSRKLTLEDMEKVSGGLVVVDDANGKYWVVREDGSVIGPAPDEEHAVGFAKGFNVSPTVITLEQYKKKFGRDLVW